MSGFRSTLFHIARAVLNGQVIRRGRDGAAHGKCPRCGAGVTFTLPVTAGQPAFTCGACGERGTWLGDEARPPGSE